MVGELWDMLVMLLRLYAGPAERGAAIGNGVDRPHIMYYKVPRFLGRAPTTVRPEPQTWRLRSAVAGGWSLLPILGTSPRHIHPSSTCEYRSSQRILRAVPDHFVLQGSSTMIPVKRMPRCTTNAVHTA